MARIIAFSIAACAGVGLSVLAAGAAHAQKIGVAAIVQNDVTRGQSTPINAGENVVRNETVRTGQASSAKIVFLDDTNLAVGPTTTVKLDRFVFAGDSDYKKATFEVARGALRFVTGNSDKRAYEINTPVATIGVRGTIFDVLSQSGFSIVKLHEGLAIVCVRGTQRCLTLSEPGQSVIVRAGSVSPSNSGFNFDSYCGSGVCSSTTYASLNQQQPGGGGGGDALCGR